MQDYLSVLAALAMFQAVAVVSPGPSFVVLTQTAIKESRTAAIFNAIGFGIGTFLWAGAAILGLALLFEAFPWLYSSAKIAGGLFIIYIAIRVWLSANTPVSSDPQTKVRSGYLANLGLGIATQLANPKVMLFFGSVFIAILPAERPVGLITAALILATVIEISWYVLLAFLFSREGVRKQYAQYKALIDRISASLLACLGLWLIFGD